MLARLEKPLRPIGLRTTRQVANWGGSSLQSLLKTSRGIAAFDARIDRSASAAANAGGVERFHPARAQRNNDGD
jgi:hypothetical protein